MQVVVSYPGFGHLAREIGIRHAQMSMDTSSGKTSNEELEFPFGRCNSILVRRNSELVIFKVGQDHICTPYMTVCMVDSLPKVTYIRRIYVCMYGFGQPLSYHILLLQAGE